MKLRSLSPFVFLFSTVVALLSTTPTKSVLGKTFSIDSSGKTTFIKTSTLQNTSSYSTSNIPSVLKLEAGFPVKAVVTEGAFMGGPGIAPVVQDINNDGYPEIILPTYAHGPIYAYAKNGELLYNWPVWIEGLLSATYLAADKTGVYAVVFQNNRITKIASDGNYIWQTNLYYAAYGNPASIDSTAGIFAAGKSFYLGGFRTSDGSSLNWPNTTNYYQWHTAANADINGDGSKEFISISDPLNGIGTMVCVDKNGNMLNGWPQQFSANVHTYPAVADFNLDGKKEIAVVMWGPNLRIYNSDGTIFSEVSLGGDIPYGTAPAIADINMDGKPEIIIQLNSDIVATDTQKVLWKKHLTSMVGENTYNTWMGNSSPAVGDLNLDGKPEIVVETQVPGRADIGDLWILKNDGSIVEGFPYRMPLGNGRVPAIADIDKDGKNEIIVTSLPWNGQSGYYDSVWAFEMKSTCKIKCPQAMTPEWGQFMHDAQHTGEYVKYPYNPYPTFTPTPTPTPTPEPACLVLGEDCDYGTCCSGLRCVEGMGRYSCQY